jgi:hypothetical protein
VLSKKTEAMPIQPEHNLQLEELAPILLRFLAQLHHPTML